jgi:hypothetical protein
MDSLTNLNGNGRYYPQRDTREKVSFPKDKSWEKDICGIVHPSQYHPRTVNASKKWPNGRLAVKSRVQGSLWAVPASQLAARLEEVVDWVEHRRRHSNNGTRSNWLLWPRNKDQEINVAVVKNTGDGTCNEKKTRRIVRGNRLKLKISRISSI